MLNQSEIEQHYFEMFRKHYPLPDGIVEYGDRPDVILRGERTIGIEITNFFLEEGGLPQSEQSQRGARDEVVSRAQRIHQTTSGRRFELTFGFNKAVPICGPNKLAKQIAVLATRVEARESGQLGREVFQDIPELSFVYLNVGEYEDARWQVCQTYTTPLMSLEQLREIIKDKEAKSQGYRRCDAYWLLVVVNFLDRAQDQEVQIDGFDAVGSEVFEKIVVYKTCLGHILETTTTAH